MPWFLREDEDVEPLEAYLSFQWSSLEIRMQETEGRRIVEAGRYVSQIRLLRDPRWRNRMLF